MYREGFEGIAAFIYKTILSVSYFKHYLEAISLPFSAQLSLHVAV